MAISIDWATKVINVPKADTTLVDIGPPEARELDLDQFRKDLNALQASEEGISFDTTHTHIAPISFGTTTLARVVTIINGYTVTFEDGSYSVTLTGANSNLLDVANLNSVSLRSNNTAGLVEISTGVSGLTTEESIALLLARDHARAANVQTKKE